MTKSRSTLLRILGIFVAVIAVALPGSLAQTARTTFIPGGPLALVTVKQDGCTQPSSPPGTLCLDLVIDRGTDGNRMPLNPRWGYQTPGLPIADARQLCSPLFVGGQRVNPACTRQSPSFDGPGISLFPPGAWSGLVCASTGGPSHGHSNWFGATYTGGPIYFEDHSSSWGGDDDYTMDLQTPDGRGSLSGNHPAGTIHLEFDSDETIDHFRSAWWSQLHERVDRGDRNFLLGQRAIVTGLMGIDWVHTPAMESHPVWALAIEKAPDEWAFFVRNFGNEGFCSSNGHDVAFDGGNYAFKFPWQPGAIDVTIPSVEIRSGWGPGFPIPGARAIIVPVRGDGVYVALLGLPSPELKPFYEGEIKLHWILGVRPPPTPPTCKVKLVQCFGEQDSPETKSDALLGPLLSPRQKAAIGALLTQPGWPDVKLDPHNIHIQPLQLRPPPLPAHGPKERTTSDPQKTKHDLLQGALLCGALGGAIPGFPTACAPTTTVLSFDDQPDGTAITNQYVSRGVTFGPADNSAETRAPRIAKVGSEANSPPNVLRFGQCFSHNCKPGMQSQLTGTFTTPHAHIGMFTGEFSPGTPTTVTLRAYDASNRLVGESQAVLTPGNGFHTPLALDSRSANITSFIISAPIQIGADDFAFS